VILMLKNLRQISVTSCVLLALGCNKAAAELPTTPKAPPGADDLLMRIDGLDIRFGEVLPYLTVLDTVGPEWSPKVKFRRVLEEFTIPLRLAQRAFAEQRSKLLEQAKALCAVATNYRELEQYATNLSAQRKQVSRRSVELPIALFLFDELLMGSVSAPIEVPRGFVVATAHELQAAPMVINDQVDCLQIGFLTHSADEWQSWIANEQVRIASLVEFVHPDFRDHMPHWLRLP
jgi:hypothetical protein